MNENLFEEARTCELCNTIIIGRPRALDDMEVCDDCAGEGV